MKPTTQIDSPDKDSYHTSTSSADICSSCDNYCEKNDSHFKMYVLGKGAVLDFDSKNSNHIIFLFSGALSISYTDKHYILGLGEMGLLVDGFEYSIEVSEAAEFLIVRTAGTIQICNTISAKSVREILKKTDFSDPILPILPAMGRILDSIKEYVGDGINCIHLNRAKSMEIFIAFRFYYTLEQIVKFFYTVLSGKFYFQSLVLANYKKAKNVLELSQLCGYGLSNFKQLFKQYYSKTPYQWMLEIRSHDVEDALKNKDIPIKVIAAIFNFSDQSHLNAYCKKYLGGTPGQIRER